MRMRMLLVSGQRVYMVRWAIMMTMMLLLSLTLLSKPTKAFSSSSVSLRQQQQQCAWAVVVRPTESSYASRSRKLSWTTGPQGRVPFTFLQQQSPSSSSSSSSDTKDDLDIYFSSKTTVALVGGQSVLVLLAVVLGAVLGVPNKGLGPDIAFTAQAWKAGFLYTLPLVGLAFALDIVEDKVPALQDVTKATQRSVLSLLGGTFKPVLGMVTATVLGLAAGFGEEMLFRGILQYELATRLSCAAPLAVGASSILFGALHAVTPMYAALATLASVYFGFLYVVTGNLAIPILCHALYDVGALLYAHWTVSRLQDDERAAIASWGGPTAGPL
eukprot:scaffold16171_cov161-Amphora_coffeaeformis.AAC.1